MKYFAYYPETQVILEAPCNKWSFSRFKEAAREWREDNGSAEIYIGRTWTGREYICKI